MSSNPAASTFPRTTGVLLHPTSLPSRHGIGDLGDGALAFVAWLKDAGCGAWQVLPLVPPGAGHSPYASLSSLAGNPLLLSLDRLVEQGLLRADEVEPPHAFPLDKVAFDAVRAFKQPRIALACARLAERPEGKERAAAFVAAEPWVTDHALFMLLKDRFGGKPFWEWPEALRHRDPHALAEVQAAEEQRLRAIVLEQALFSEQWAVVRKAANDRGIRLIGDIPIYVSDDSVDVWANRRFFLLGDDDRPSFVAGVPPDAFTELGQWWGSPLYRWDALAKEGHAFWVQRLQRNLALTDIVRIDHFRGFAGYWAIPATAEDARSGRWVRGPGAVLFDDLRRALGDNLPIIAEDLGVITPDVETLRDGVGLPGMKVLQFAFGGGNANPFLPHHHQQNSVVYTGTHDNDTTLGWWQKEPEHAKAAVRRYLGKDGHDIVWDMIRLALSSVAHTAVVPLQDILALDSGARMNMPGTVEDNWAWRVRREAFHHNLSRRLRELGEAFDRVRDPARDAARAAELTKSHREVEALTVEHL